MIILQKKCGIVLMNAKIITHKISLENGETVSSGEDIAKAFNFFYIFQSSKTKLLLQRNNCLKYTTCFFLAPITIDETK